MNYLRKVEYVPEKVDVEGERGALADPVAERAALAAFITRPESRRKLAAELRLHHFTDPTTRKLWVVAVDLHSKDASIDQGILVRELGRREIKVAGPDVEAVFANAVGDPAGDVAQIVKLHRHRWALDQSAEIRRLALDTSVNIANELEEKAQEILKAIRQSGLRHDGTEGRKRFNQRIEDLINGRIKNIAWPFAPMMTTIARALESCTITMVGGTAGDGKTFLILQSLIGWIEQGVSVSVCMLEKRDAWHLHRSLAILEGNARILDGKWCEDNPEKMRDACDRHAETIDKLSASLHEGGKVGTSLGEIGRWIDRELDYSDIVVVDPISLADQGDKRWLADSSFIQSCIRAIERTNGRVILVTHPNANTKVSGLASLMGGQVYQRATDAVLHISKHDKPKRYQVIRHAQGSALTHFVAANRTISIFKGRNATHSGSKFACNFENLSYVEQGWILVDDKARSSDDDDDDQSESDVPEYIFR